MDDMKCCGNCGWDGVTPLHGEDPKMNEYKVPLERIADESDMPQDVPDDPSVSWGKQGDWMMYKQEHIPMDPSGPDDTRLKGCLVFYVDVGQLPPYKAEAFVERMAARFNSERLKKNYEIMFIPVRPNSQTRVEYIPLNY